jgi:3'-phosphoadenosine 5'-phosphosulfate sulfotransferase (PAPS reductase)/FAD synthetase
MAKLWYEPDQNQLTKLEQPWICSYSGGKDSTSLVTWIEWLRRKGWISVDQPRLVMSDTDAEYPFLMEVSRLLTTLLEKHGWIFDIVKPPIHKKLYNAIFGRGVPPVHPSHRKRMRWCTNATKVQPMGEFVDTRCPLPSFNLRDCAGVSPRSGMRSCWHLVVQLEGNAEFPHQG